MKKKLKKLTLSKSTISSLNPDQAKEVKGGSFSWTYTCCVLVSHICYTDYAPCPTHDPTGCATC